MEEIAFNGSGKAIQGESMNGITLLKSGINYFFFKVFALISGLILIPILTRQFGAGEYGQISFIESIVSLVSLMACFGLPQSLIRFYPTYGVKENEKKGFFFSYILATVLIGLLFTVLYLGICMLPVAEDSEFGGLLLFSGILIIPTGLSGILLTVFRVEEHTKTHATLLAVEKIVFMLCIVLIFSFVSATGYSYFISRFLGTFAVIVMSVVYARPYMGYGRFNKQLISESVKYGAPLVLLSLGSFILNLGDRFIIKMLLGNSELGIYSVAYNLTTNIEALIVFPFNILVYPVYIKKWENEGKENTEDFLMKSIDIYLLISIPTIFGLYAVKDYLFQLFTTSEYYAGSSLILPLITGLLTYGLYFITVAGLFIKKKTKTISIIIIIAAGMNVIMNMILIPELGTLGAAIATLISYFFYFFVTLLLSKKYIKIKFNFRAMLVYLISSIIMLLVISNLYLSKHMILNLCLMMVLGIIIYSGLVLLLIKRHRDFVLLHLRNKGR